jgi:hypothetical protein
MKSDISCQRPAASCGGTYEEVIAVVPQEGGDAALEVVLTHDGAGGMGVELRSVIWGHGVGWYRQHTIAVDRKAIRALCRGLECARRRLDDRSNAWHASNVIPFPRRRRAPEGAAPGTTADNDEQSAG